MLTAIEEANKILTEQTENHIRNIMDIISTSKDKKNQEVQHHTASGQLKKSN